MTVTADDQTQNLRRPDWDGPTDAFPVVAVSQPVPVPAPMPAPVRPLLTRYTPAGETKYQLSSGNMFVGVAAALPIISGFLAKVFELHPLGYYYGYIWGFIFLVTCAGFKTDETYVDEAAAWRASSNKMVAASISCVVTIIVWGFVWLAYQ